MAYPGYYGSTRPGAGYDNRYGYEGPKYDTRSLDRLDDRQKDRYLQGPPPQYPQAYQPQVVTSQPMRMDGPRMHPRQWSSGVFDCTKDMKTCLCMWCCGEFYACYLLDTEFDEHCCNGWPCGPGGPGAFFALRYKMRNQLNIEGSMMGDCWTTTCCYPCVVCQLKRENDVIKNAGDMRVGHRHLKYVTERRAEDMYNPRY